MGSRADTSKIACNAKNIKLVETIVAVWKVIDFMFGSYVLVRYSIVKSSQ